VVDEEEMDEMSAHEEGLDEAELAALVAGFKGLSVYPIVVLAAATGARRNELLALRWTDLDVEKNTLRIERALEPTKKFGLRVKPPKTKRGLRTIDIDDATIAVLLAEKERHQRLVAGIPDGVDIDLSLVRLPEKALMFPSPEGELDLTKWRSPADVSKQFRRKADLLGFGIKFHTLRGIHATALLDANVPLDLVAKRIGDDPVTLLRSYTKRKRSRASGEAVSAALTAMASGFLK
jgi:integrase